MFRCVLLTLSIMLIVQFLLPVSDVAPVAEQRMVSSANQDLSVQSPFGIVLNPYRPDVQRHTLEKVVRYLQDAGIGWTRNLIAWNKLEPQKGIFNEAAWRKYDRFIDQLLVADIHPVIFVGHIPVWVHTGPPRRALKHHGKQILTAPTPHPADFADFVYRVVSRYKDKVGYYQLMNEMGQKRRAYSPQLFVEIMAAGYQAAKRAAPESKIIMGGSGPHKGLAKYFEDVLIAGGGNYCDIVDLRFYGPTSEVVKHVKILKALMAKYNTSRPIWMTEGGIVSDMALGPTTQRKVRRLTKRGQWDYPIPATKETQARQLIKRYVIALSLGVEKKFWSRVGDIEPAERIDPLNKASAAKTKPLFQYDLTPKPAYFAYKTLIHIVDSKKYKDGSKFEENLQWHRFARDGAMSGVFWVWREHTQVTLRTPAPSLTVIDKFNQNRTVSAKEGTVVLSVTSNPFFVVGQFAVMEHK